MKLVVWQDDQAFSLSVWEDANFATAESMVRAASESFWEDFDIDHEVGTFSYSDADDFFAYLKVTDVTPEEAVRIGEYFGTTDLSTLGTLNALYKVAQVTIAYVEPESDDDDYDEDEYDEDDDDYEDEENVANDDDPQFSMYTPLN